jgi:aerobic carbon-monoxide dehydrogenase medium subunit
VKAAPFSYTAPHSLDEVIEVLARYEDDAKVLAGGQSLVPVLALRLSRFEQLVDLQHVPDMTGVSRSNGTVRIAAMTTHTAVGQAAESAAVPLLTKAAPFIGHGAIRNRGTLGGAIAHADPAAEWPAVATALDAELEVTGPDGTRTIPAAEFFLGTWTTAMEPAEVLVAAHFPVWQGACGFAVEEAARRHGDFAMAGIVCGVQVDGGRVTRAGLALLGVGGTPVRAAAAEQALVGSAVADVDVAAVAAVVAGELDPPDDLHASGEQRRRMSRVLAERAVRNAITEATTDGGAHGA